MSPLFKGQYTRPLMTRPGQLRTADSGASRYLEHGQMVAEATSIHLGIRFVNLLGFRPHLVAQHLFCSRSCCVPAGNHFTEDIGCWRRTDWGGVGVTRPSIRGEPSEHKSTVWSFLWVRGRLGPSRTTESNQCTALLIIRPPDNRKESPLTGLRRPCRLCESRPSPFPLSSVSQLFPQSARLGTNIPYLSAVRGCQECQSFSLG